MDEGVRYEGDGWYITTREWENEELFFRFVGS
jgi:hypothetical protein